MYLLQLIKSKTVLFTVILAALSVAQGYIGLLPLIPVQQMYGGITSTCVLVVSNVSATPAADHYLPSRNNAILYGSGQVLGSLLIRDKISFTYTDGLDTYGAEVGYDDEAVTIKQKNSGSASAEVLKILDNTGAVVFSFRNDGYILSGGRITATSVSTVKQVMPIYDVANALVGYVPIYTTYA